MSQYLDEFSRILSIRVNPIGKAIKLVWISLTLEHHFADKVLMRIRKYANFDLFEDDDDDDDDGGDDESLEDIDMKF